MSTSYDVRNVAQEIADGEHDDDLADIREAIARRERMLSPSDAVQVLAQVYGIIDQVANGQHTAQMRAQAGMELNGKLREYANDPNPHIVALVNAARVEVLVRLLNVPRSTATRLGEEGDDNPSDDDAPDCSQCGASNAGSREAPHLCETCRTKVGVVGSAP